MEEEVVVQADPVLKKKKLGFWGRLGDAFSLQGGGKAWRQARLDEENLASALRPITSDPDLAVRNLLQIGRGDEAIGLYDKVADNRRADTLNAARVTAQREGYIKNTHDRAFSLLGAATPETYAGLRNTVQNYYKSRGVDPLFELPETYNKAQLAALRMGGVDPEDQVRLEETADMNDRRIAQGDRAEAGRNSRYQMGLGVRVAEGNRNRDAAMKRTQYVQDRLDKRKTLAKPASGPVKPDIGEWIMVDGVRKRKPK